MRALRRRRTAAASAAMVLVLASARLSAAPVLNEIVVRPASGEGEWVEVWNPGPDPVDLAGWTLADGTGHRRTLEPERLEPGGMLLLAARPESLRAAYALPGSVRVVRPSGWPVLNDHDGSGGAPADVVVLAAPGGAAVDSVAYHESWLPPEDGRSLERVAPDRPGTEAGSWGWSVDPAGATPGRTNSLAGPSPAPDAGALLAGPAVVAPARRPALFGWRLPGPGTVTLGLVDGEGRRVALLRPAAPAPAAGRWVWGAEAPAAPRAGRYYLCLRFRGEDGRVRRSCLPVWVER